MFYKYFFCFTFNLHCFNVLSSLPRQTLLESKSCQVTLQGVSPSQWVKLNPGTVGVYRTRYSAALLDLLKQGITEGQLPPRDRLGLQNDLFAFSKAGEKC